MIKDGVRYELHTLKFLLSVLGMSFALHDAKRAGAKCEPHPSMSNPSSLRQRLDHNIVAPPSISIATDQAKTHFQASLRYLDGHRRASEFNPHCCLGANRNWGAA
jgi:hypothetical protein